jgi:hypothetical protein
MLCFVAAAVLRCSAGADAPAPQEPAPPQEKPPVAAPQEKPAEPPAQEKPARSQALEELLRRLARERGLPPIVPPSPLQPVPPEGEGEAAAAPATRARLLRAADSVQVVKAGGARRDLQFWDARLDLDAGDEVRQGPRGETVLEFEDGAHYRIDGRAVWRLESSPSASPRRIDFLELRRFASCSLGHGEIDTVLTLPGGNQLAGRGARVTILDRDLRALEIRNTGPEPVVVRSPYLGDRTIALGAGQRIFLPVMPEPAAFLRHLTHDASLFDERRGRLVVQAQDEVALSAAGDSIDLAGRGPAAGLARACGARFVLQPGQALRLTRAPLGVPRQTEWDE